MAVKVSGFVKLEKTFRPGRIELTLRFVEPASPFDTGPKRTDAVNLGRLSMECSIPYMDGS